MWPENERGPSKTAVIDYLDFIRIKSYRQVNPDLPNNLQKRREVSKQEVCFIGCGKVCPRAVFILLACRNAA